MAPIQSLPIDQVWAESLVGLRLKVPGSWWHGEPRKRHLFACKVAKVDFTKENRKYFQIDVLEESGVLWPMRYDAVAGYVDTEHDTFKNFQVPEEEVPDPANERAQVSRRRQRREENTTSIESDDDGETGVVEGGDDDNGEENVYIRTEPGDWKMYRNNETGHRTIEPLPYTGGNEDATVNITDEEVEEMKDANGDIRFYKIFLWSLARFSDNQTLFEWQSKRMNNYMLHLKTTSDFKPKYFDPETNPITADNVARMYGVIVANCLCGNRSVEQIWSTRDALDAIETIKSSMCQDAWKDMSRCIHFADDWEDDDERWNENYPAERCAPSPQRARHRKKHGTLEDAYNKRWRTIVKAGRWLTADESRVAGWFHSSMTIGPEPKPIRTGATLHTLCVTHGPLRTFKLFARTYGGKYDADLDQQNVHTATLQKFVNLFDIMLDPFKNDGRCVTMDSAYMGDIMALIGRNEWKFNMVGTSNENRTGAPATKELKKTLKTGSYDSLRFQHNKEQLCYALWADNNIVRTLSNFHDPTLLQEGEGMRRRGREDDGRRSQDQSDVPCPVQNRDYSETYHLIDKGNGKESKFDLQVNTKSHGWTPKLACRFFSMHLNNAFLIYTYLVKKYTPNKKYLEEMRDAVKELAHALLQTGKSLREQRPEVPPPTRDLVSVFPNSGRKIRSDAIGQVSVGVRPAEQSTTAMSNLRKKQKTHHWRIHQSVACAKRGRCAYNGCPNLTISQAKEKRSYDTYMRCEQCTLEHDKSMYFCNDTKKGKPVLCHMLYHQQYCKKNEDY